MKARDTRQQPAPRRVSLGWALLALVLVTAQPAHWMACCLAAVSGAHPTPSASHGHSERNDDAARLWDVAHEAADAEAAAHVSPTLDAHSDEFVITPHCIRPTHHHHPSCTECGTPVLTQRTARHGVDAVFATTFAAPAVPVFRLDVLEGRCTRAGPPDAPLFSLHLVSSLLGRAPPLSA